MQDSLEDYLKISKHTRQEPLKTASEAWITAQRKKECSTKAIQIVEFLIEGKLRPEVFLKCLPYINQSYYQDIVEERAITKLCGYPICGKQISDMPKKQYLILTKTNQVYDITDRKNFCSNVCYKASVHIKEQIDDIPLWLRKYEVTKEFNLLHKSQGGLPGELIDQGIAKPVVEPTFTSVSAFTEVSLEEIGINEIQPQKDPIQKKKNTVKTMKSIPEEDEQIANQNKAQTLKTEPIKVPLKKGVEENRALKVEKESASKKINIEAVIRKCLKEWFTLETLIFLHGESNIKEILDHKKLRDYFDTLKITQLQIEQQQKYVDICRKLHLKEFADEKFDDALMGNSTLRPIPDYRKLKEENRNIDLQVKSFYGGTSFIASDTNFPVEKNEQQQEEEPPIVLPLVEAHSQNAMRRNVFLNSLNKIMQSFLQNLKVDPTRVLPDVQGLVKTFHLTADNIVFKPIVWNYITIVLLKILAVKEDHIRTFLSGEKATNFVNLYMNLLPKKGQLVVEAIEMINNVEKFVIEFITVNNM